MDILRDILKSITKPGRDIAELSRLVTTLRAADPSLNKSLDSLDKKKKASEKAMSYAPKYVSQEEQLGTFLRPVETTLRNAATVGSMVAPVGVAGNIGSRAGYGALGAGMASYGMTPITEDTDPLKILGGAALGGAIGGTIGAVEKGIMSKATKKFPGKVQDFGAETRGKAIGLDANRLANKKGSGISSATQGKKTIKSFLNTMDELGIPVNTSEMASTGSDDALAILGDQFKNNVLNRVDDSVVFTSKDTGKLINKIQSAFKNNPKITQNAQYQELLGDLLSLGDNYKPSQLNLVREKARELINWSSTSKAAVSERASRQVFGVIDDFFKQSVPGSSEVLGKMKDIYAVRPLLQAKAPTAGAMKVGTASTNIAVPSGALQERIPSMVGETLQKGIQMPQLSPEVLSKVGSAGIFGTRLGQALGQEQAPQGMSEGMGEMGEMGEMGAQQGMAQQPQIDETAIIQAVLSGQLSTTEAKFIMDTLGGGSTQKLSKDQANAQSALESLNQMEQILSTDQNALFKSYLPFQGLDSNAQILEQSALNVEDIIARMRTGAVINDEEAERYRKMIPRITDTAETKVMKLGQLRNIFNNILNRGGSESSGVSDSELAATLQVLGLQ